MKNVKLSILLLSTVFVLHAMPANAFFGNTFSKFAAFAKTKAASVSSFFNSSAKPRFNFVNPFAKRFAFGVAVAAPVVTVAIPTEANTLTYSQAQDRYMVAHVEKIGVGKKEYCHTIKVRPSLLHDDYTTISMYCPKASAVLGLKSDNAVLHALHKKSKLEIARIKLQENGILTTLDKDCLDKESGISTETTLAELDQHIQEVDRTLADLSTEKVSQPGTIFDPMLSKKGFGGDYWLYTTLKNDKYTTIAKSLREQEAAKQKAAQK